MNFSQCDLCGHTYSDESMCRGEPIPCSACCTDSLGNYVYTPIYEIPEMAL